MRTRLRRLLTAGALALTMAGTAGAVPAGAATTGTTATADGAAAGTGATAQSTDILDRLEAVPGMSLVQEKPVDGYRYFILNYTQPVDHRHPRRGTFQQRLSVLYKSDDRPTVFHTSGYGLSTNPGRSEPTRIVDGNQVSMEYRFFTPSRPDPADWTKLDIWQAATDQHRIFRALRPILDHNWISTGGSKGGMTATYYRRFYPEDMDGTVAYVAPNDVDNDEDSAYTEFLANVGTDECRGRLEAVQREVLLRRDDLVARYEAYAKENGYTFTTVGSADRALEVSVLDLAWAFWQYSGESDCASVPVADEATDDELWEYVDLIAGWSFYTDQGLEYYTPYYYQAGTQLGAPSFDTPHLKGLLKHPDVYEVRNFVPRSIPMEFDERAMRDVDRWVHGKAERMLFVYGENDPWRAEPFTVGRKAKDSYVYTAPGANHGANIARLVEDERTAAVASVLEWAGLAEDADSLTAAEARPQAEYDAKLDKAGKDYYHRNRHGRP
ncbi:S28 family serine protease [Streptomyces sp. NPDC059637]|uniref:S28 family serine protease n=1 Tax=Streptomyces sp. NPDC059637 TaxID=3347752 RepID=UPI00368C5553